MMGLETRADWKLTSAGVGHDYRPHVHFPPSEMRSTLSDPLPPNLQQPSEVTAFDELANTYETTTGSIHTQKYPWGILGQPRFLKAPPHWTVHYNKDLREKLRTKRTNPDPPNKCSEMRSEFQGRPLQPFQSVFNSSFQPFPLKDHLNRGPSQTIVATTMNKELAGEPFYIKDKGVLNLNDIYSTTTARDFRAFTNKELEGYAKKDALTYWQAEDYPKVWGHGLKENPLPKQAYPTLRQRPPMLDTQQFSTRITLPQVAPKIKALPSRAFKTLVQESFQWPLDVKRSDDVYCPLECPWTTTSEGPLPAIMSVPKMYRTVNEAYGSQRPLTI